MGVVIIDGKCTLEVVLGDITKENSAAIVNAAKNSLLGGGGVDGAIHRAGGPSILEECKRLNGCETGDAKITGAGNLNSLYVIHTVGPVYHDGLHGESDLLESCYKRCLEIAMENHILSISFPAISCGVYGYPHHEAARIAIRTVISFVKEHPGMTSIRFVLFEEDIYKVFDYTLEELFFK